VGAATGVGSLPGSDITEAVKLSFGELPDLPHLPELPGRGAGADLIGRGAALLAELPVELYAGRWRIAAHRGVDLRHTLDLWERDLDALTEIGSAFAGPVKVQVAGPWTLAASIAMPLGGPVLHDHGATRDLADSLAEGLRLHVADLRARLPLAEIVLQLDEPSLPAVLAGQIPTESGLRTLRSVPEDVGRSSLRSIVETCGAPVVVHCCAGSVPVPLLRSAGVAAVGLDVSLLKTPDLDALGEFLDGGGVLFAGAVPSTGTRAPASADVAASVTSLWNQLGFPPPLLPQRVVVTPACGLAGATPAYARAALRAGVEAGRRLAEA
jgi:methionine synthase II (cobalamin-independent)